MADWECACMAGLCNTGDWYMLFIVKKSDFENKAYLRS